MGLEPKSAVKLHHFLPLSCCITRFAAVQLHHFLPSPFFSEKSPQVEIRLFGGNVPKNHPTTPQKLKLGLTGYEVLPEDAGSAGGVEV